MPKNFKFPAGFSAVVLHTHTSFSDGVESPERLVKAAANYGIRLLAVTDHDTMAGIDEAKKAGRMHGVEIVAGEEIQTSLPRGLHIIGLFLKNPIPHSKSVEWTIGEIHRQGGLAIIAHPLTRIIGILSPTGAFQMRDLLNLDVKVDGIEVSYPSITQADERRLDIYYQENKAKLGAKIGSSDSHFGEKDMFSLLTLFRGNSAPDLYRAIKNRSTSSIEGFRQEIELGDRISLHKRALVNMGIRRYGAMGRRWISLDFKNVDEFLG